MAKNDDFFDKQSASSEVKAKIISEYFPQYARIISNSRYKHKAIRYVDLFAGPGIYNDSKESTPVLLAKHCAADLELAKNVHLIFNDMEKSYIEQLEANIFSKIPVNAFKHKPYFQNKKVGFDDKINDYLNKEVVGRNEHPTLLFFDPWGYKGINTLSLAKFLGNWGNEIFLFINIKRIQYAITVGKFDEMMIALFPTTIGKIRLERKYKATVYERLQLIMENLALEFDKAVTGKQLFSCGFKFQEEDSVATSHFIMHFTKHSRGFELVKQVFYDYDNIGSNLERDGTYTFDAKKMGSSVIEFGDENIRALSSQISGTFKGRTLSARKLFDEHQAKTKWAGSHYVKTLRHMVADGSVKASFLDEKNHKVSVLLTNHCILNFN